MHSDPYNPNQPIPSAPPQYQSNLEYSESQQYYREQYQPVYQEGAYQPYSHNYYPQTYGQPEYAEMNEDEHANIAKEGDSSFGCGTGEFGDRMDYNNRKWQDVWALIVWLIAMASMVYALVHLYTNGSSNDNVNTTGVGNTILIIGVVAIVGLSTGFLWMSAIKRCAADIIKTMLYANLALWVLATLTCLAMGLMLPTIISLVCLILFAVYVYYVKPRIPLAATILTIGIRIIDGNNATLMLQLVIATLQIGWILWWGAVAYAYSANYSNEALVFAGLIAILYWTLEVFANISHTTICGVSAVWFFSKTEKNPTWAAFKFASTKGLGSVCCGSLLVALVQTARALVKNAQNNNRGNSLIVCLVQCLLSCLESLIRFFSTYAYAQVAIYGTSFIESSKRTWDLLTNKGVDAWINDDLTGFALGCGALVGALIASMAGFVLSSIFDENMRMGYLIAGFVMGYFLCATVMMVVRSAVIAIFVCWAEDPSCMAYNRPLEFNQLAEQWAKLYSPRQ